MRAERVYISIHVDGTVYSIYMLAAAAAAAVYACMYRCPTS